jgi:hypothetical protein
MMHACMHHIVLHACMHHIVQVPYDACMHKCKCTAPLMHSHLALQIQVLAFLPPLSFSPIHVSDSFKHLLRQGMVLASCKPPSTYCHPLVGLVTVGLFSLRFGLVPSSCVSPCHHLRKTKRIDKCTGREIVYPRAREHLLTGEYFAVIVLLIGNTDICRDDIEMRYQTCLENRVD